MAVRSIKKALAGMEDLAAGIGKAQQQRAGKLVTVGKIDVPYAVLSVGDLKALDVTKFSYARLDGFPYQYDANDDSGVKPDDGPGSWIKGKGHEDKHVSTISNAGDSQLAGGNIWPYDDTLIPLGMQSTSVPSGVSRLKVDTGAVGGELLYLWEISGDFPSSSHVISNVIHNQVLDEYTVTTDIGSFTFTSKANRKFRDSGDIRGWGAKAGSNATTQIIAAAAYCLSAQIKLIGDGGVYQVNGDGLIDLSSVNCHLDVELDFVDDSTGYILIGGKSNTVKNPSQYIRTIRVNGGRDINTPLCILKGTKNQTVTVDICESLSIHPGNADAAEKTSVAYSTFYFNYVNRLSIKGDAKGSSALGGWVNENTFYLKRCVELLIGDEDPDTYSHNNNVFHGGTFEGSSKITINGGNDNTLNSVRLESADDNAISFSSRTINNKVIVSWVESFADQPVYDWNYKDLGRGNVVFSNDNAAYSEHPVFALNSDILLFDNDTKPTKCNIQGVGNWTSINENGTPTGSYYLKKSGKDISCSTFSVICRSPQCQISTTKDSLITISSGGWSGGGYRLIIHGYDNDGNVMTPGPEDVVTVGFPTASFGSQIQTSNVTNSRLYINRAGCRFISISVICGSVAASFRWLNVSIKNPKATTRTNGAEVRLPSSYIVPFNTPKLN